MSPWPTPSSPAGIPNTATASGGRLPRSDKALLRPTPPPHGSLGWTSSNPALLPFRSIPQPTPRSAARRRSSSAPFSGTTPPSPLHPHRLRVLVPSPVSPAPFQKSLTLASSAASTSAPPASSATR